MTNFIDHDVYSRILHEIPIACVDIVIKNNRQVLLVKRKKTPAKNQWWFPGGRIYKGESIIDASLRKAASETGLICKFVEIMGVEETYFPRTDDMNFDIHTINIVVQLKIEKYSNVRLDNDHSEYMWARRISPEFHPSIQNSLNKAGLAFAPTAKIK